MHSNRSLVSQFFSGTLAIGTARVFTIIFGFVSLMFTLRNVSTAEYGAYILIFVIISFLIEFTSLGLSLAIPKYMASSEDDQYINVLLNTIFYFRLITIVVVSAIFLILKPILIPFFGESLLLDLFLYVPIFFGLGSMAHLLRSILTGKFGFTTMGIIEFVSNGCELVFILILVQYFKFGLNGLLAAKIISGIVAVLWAYLASNIKHDWVFDSNLLKKMLRFGFPLQMQFILEFVFSRLDTLIIGSTLGTTGVAFYEVARKIPDSLMQFFSVFISVYFPISANLHANEKKDRIIDLINNAIRILSFLTLFAAVVAVIFGHDVIKLIFSEKYISSYLTFALLMIGISLKFLEETLGYSLIAIGDPDKPLIVNFVRAIVSLVGNLLLLPVLGFVGAAIVSLVSNVVAIPLDSYFLWKRNIPPKILEYIKPFAAFSILSLAFLFLNPSQLVYKGVIAILYFPICLALSVITTRDMALVYHEANLTIARIFGPRTKKV